MYREMRQEPVGGALDVFSSAPLTRHAPPVQDVNIFTGAIIE